MFNTRLTVNAGSVVQKNPLPQGVKPAAVGTKVEANWIRPTIGNPISTQTFGGPNFTTMFQGIIPEYNEVGLIPYYRDIYYHDPVAGAAVDISTTFPFSDLALTGLDSEDLQAYNETLSRLNFRTLMSEIAMGYLVDGLSTNTLVYDHKREVFQDVLQHDALNTSITPQPFHSLDPVIKVNSAHVLNQLINAGSPYLDSILESYPPGVVDIYRNGTVVLDPLTTLFVGRKGPSDREYVSYLKRIMPMYMLEKVLYRGTLTEAHKRQRSTSHIMVGTENWIASDNEMQGILQEFQRSELDPLGAWIVTREGVQVNEIRPAGEMWKWTDLVDTMVPYKLRALGISEAFLSGDASYACLSGDTLIPTTEGLRRIDSFGSGKDRAKVVPIKATVDGRFGAQKASSWQYNGYQRTFKVTTNLGNSVQATGNHPLLVLDGTKTVWKRTDKISVGDVLCVSKNKVVRTIPLKLNVPLPAPRTGKTTEAGSLNAMGDRRGLNSRKPLNPGEMIVPTHMTPKLAYWLALFVSEGYTIGTDSAVLEEGRTARIGFGNSDRRLVQRFSSLAEELFGVEVTGPEEGRSAEELNSVNPGFEASKRYYTARIDNRRLVDWLEAIGAHVRPGKVDGKLASYRKEVPWSVLQADEESQRAFLAAYAECDGCVGKRSSWISVSTKLLDQIRAILNSHGFQPATHHNGGPCSSVVLYAEESALFWAGAAKYLSLKTPKIDGIKYSYADGIPAKAWKDIFLKAKQGWNRHGTMIKCADGEIRQFTCQFGCSLGDLQFFNYRRYAEGLYDGFLDVLKEIDPAAHADLISLIETPYRFARVVSVEDAGKSDVYDLSMRPGEEPAFVANGLVVHNTAETAITVFLDSMDAFRQLITYRVFTKKIFPLIAILKGFYKDPSKKEDMNSVAAVIANLNNHKNLRIPQVNWFKSLNGKDTESQWDMLDKLSEKGFTIPLKMWAAAASVDITSLLQDLQEDQEIKEKLEQVTGQRAESIGVHEDSADSQQEFGEPGPGDELASLLKSGTRSLANSVQRKRVPLLSRKMDPQMAAISKSGKVRHSIVREGVHSKKVNNNIIKAMKALQDPNHRASVRKRAGKSGINL